MRLSCLSTTFLGLLLCATGIETASAETRLVNSIVAKVNGRVITKNRLELAMLPLARQLKAQHPRRNHIFDAKLKEISDKVLQDLIDRELILDEFNHIGNRIPDQMIDNQVKREIDRLYGGDRAKFNEYLKANELTMHGFRQEQKERMIVRFMRNEQTDDAAPPLPNEIRNEYAKIKDELRDMTKDKVTFRKIFIPAKDVNDTTMTRDTQLALAEIIAKEIKEGGDFADLAKKNSRDAYADKGGLQENVPRIDISAEFADIIFDAKEGELIGPLNDRNDSGFHIILPIKIELGPAPSFGEVREVVEKRVQTKKSSKQYEAWIQKLRDRAIISRTK